MGINYAEEFNPRRTPHAERTPGRDDEVENYEGGYVFEADPRTMLDRFLVLGTEGGAYYENQHDLTVQNARNVLSFVTKSSLESGEGGRWAIGRAIDISKQGRALRNGPAIFVLALASTFGDRFTREAAHDAVPEVCRTFHHLTTWLNYLKALGRGTGSVGVKRAIGSFYRRKDLHGLAYQMTKYRERNGWTQRDVLLTGHVTDHLPPENSEFGYILGRAAGLLDGPPKEILSPQGRSAEGYLQAVDKVRADERLPVLDLTDTILTHKLPREVVPQHHLNDAGVWDALLEDMPMTALIRNLPKMSAVGLLTPLSDAENRVVTRLADTNRLHRARIHPLQLLSAMRVYLNGSNRHLSWTPSQRVSQALAEAFYQSFDAIEPTYRRMVLAVDASASMGGPLAGIQGLSMYEAAAVMAMVTARTEPYHAIVAYSSELQVVDISASASLPEVCEKMRRVPHRATNCALPMLWAMELGVEADAFVQYTDSISWMGMSRSEDMKPSQALVEYRAQSGIDARMAVAGMAGYPFTIADPKDPGQMDFVGFSTDTPSAVSQFAAGLI